MESPRIYLDHNATTPLDPAVRAEMLEALDCLGNPSSLHTPGQEARRLLDRARRRVARLIGASPQEILFTSSGTEADNLAILGVAGAGGPRHAVSTAIEHQAVLQPLRHLESQGWAVDRIPADREGRVDADRLASAIRPDTALVSVMLANNDTGVIQPLAAMAERTRERGVILHTDAVQAAGKVPIDVRDLGVDLLSFSSHKLCGPKGAGALWVRPGIRLAPVLFGGHQERGLRPGTENLPAIVGFGRAAELASARLEAEAARLAAWREAFEAAILARVPGSVVHGRGAPRLSNTSLVGLSGIDGEMLAIHLDLLGVAVSTGAACLSADREPSPVLLAMGCTPEEARSAVRFSAGPSTTDAERVEAVERVVRAVAALRAG
jgi:cysteine desulfurase